jgi:hypothetical protein
MGPALFRRFPWRWRSPGYKQILPPGTLGAEDPEFGPDLTVLAEEVLPYFQRFDTDALRRQHQFRRDQILLIFGGALAAVLGAIQAAVPSETWPSLVETILAGLLTGVAFRQRALRAREGYSNSRLKAETLRSEYFLYLARVGQYADDETRIERLIRRVVAIRNEVRISKADLGEEI